MEARRNLATQTIQPYTNYPVPGSHSRNTMTHDQIARATHSLSRQWDTPDTTTQFQRLKRKTPTRAARFVTGALHAPRVYVSQSNGGLVTQNTPIKNVSSSTLEYVQLYSHRSGEGGGIYIFIAQFYKLNPSSYIALFIIDSWRMFS